MLKQVTITGNISTWNSRARHFLPQTTHPSQTRIHNLWTGWSTKRYAVWHKQQSVILTGSQYQYVMTSVKSLFASKAATPCLCNPHPWKSKQVENCSVFSMSPYLHQIHISFAIPQSANCLQICITRRQFENKSLKVYKHVTCNFPYTGPKRTNIHYFWRCRGARKK